MAVILRRLTAKVQHHVFSETQRTVSLLLNAFSVINYWTTPNLYRGNLH